MGKIITNWEWHNDLEDVSQTEFDYCYWNYKNLNAISKKD
jgi:hypothetical protein